MTDPFEEEQVQFERCVKPTFGDGISYSDIATKLLKENFLLTALELHTELVEAGRELPKLKEFFSNPGNFEQASLRPETLPSIRSLSAWSSTYSLARLMGYERVRAFSESTWIKLNRRFHVAERGNGIDSAAA
uniref:Uncharacterized protein n=1 Tax=Timema cristinae TaxID=61476 RepID=A0A7R9D7H4_TIMCR|nr:unnamed protein product [Timema cristinae]